MFLIPHKLTLIFHVHMVDRGGVCSDPMLLISSPSAFICITIWVEEDRVRTVLLCERSEGCYRVWTVCWWMLCWIWHCVMSKERKCGASRGTFQECLKVYGGYAIERFEDGRWFWNIGWWYWGYSSSLETPPRGVYRIPKQFPWTMIHLQPDRKHNEAIWGSQNFYWVSVQWLTRISLRFFTLQQAAQYFLQAATSKTSCKNRTRTYSRLLLLWCIHIYHLRLLLYGTCHHRLLSWIRLSILSLSLYIMRLSVLWLIVWLRHCSWEV